MPRPRTVRSIRENASMKLTGTIVAASAMLLAGGAAQAMPVAPLSSGDASVTLLRGGCGFGAYRGARGFCHR